MRHARKDYERFQDPALEDHTLLGEGSNPIWPDEPVFLLRAQDKHAANAVGYYAQLVRLDPNVDPEFARRVIEWSREMEKWQNKKSPDMPG